MNIMLGDGFRCHLECCFKTIFTKHRMSWGKVVFCELCWSQDCTGGGKMDPAEGGQFLLQGGVWTMLWKLILKRYEKLYLLFRPTVCCLLIRIKNKGDQGWCIPCVNMPLINILFIYFKHLDNSSASRKSYQVTQAIINQFQLCYCDDSYHYIKKCSYIQWSLLYRFLLMPRLTNQ